MAKKIKTVQDWKDELQNSGAFTDASGTFHEEEANRHIQERLKIIEAEIKKWNELKFAIQGHYKELDRLSGKKYRLFNVPTWKEDLNNLEREYKHFFKNLQEESKLYNAKWGKATKKELRDRQDEWLKDNNHLVEMQKKSLEDVEKLAAKAMDSFRNGLNIFDRLTPHIEAMFKGMVKGVNETKDGLNKMWTAYKEWTEPWARANQVAADFSKNVGLGAAGMKNLLAETIRFANASQIGIKYNKSLEEMIKLQQEYANVVGRNISLADSYKESLAAMSAVMGDQKTADIAGKLENFGINPEETGRRIGKMFADASKKGIAFSKYSETFANNIKMAQNYTFANGVKGVASMAEKATKLRLEMQSVAQFAEKVSTVEGAITTGAKLQVLGGSFTQFADPLQMLYEGTSDTEGIQDRIINMFGNLGRFNKLTGEVEVSAFDRQRIKAAGEAIGVNSAELMDMIHAKGKRNEIANQMRGLGYSSELQELIMNTASFNENGQAGVSINGQFVGVDQLAGREQELIALNQSESEDIKEIATLLRGWDDTIQGAQKQKDIKQASWVEKSGLGSLGMRAIQYLGQANWALNTIVGLITTGKAINFGMGAYGTAAGVTRTGAAAFQRVRMNKWMKKMGLDGKNLKYSQRVVGKNIGTLIFPDGSGNRSAGVGGVDNSALIRSGYESQGADLGISTGGVPLDPNRVYGTFMSAPGYVAHTPSKSSGAGTPSSGSVGTPNMMPTTGKGRARNATSTSTTSQAKPKGRGGVKPKKPKAPKYALGIPGEQLQSNEVIRLKNGQTVRLGEFVTDSDKPNQAVHPKTKQRITLNDNGQYMLTQQGQRGFTNIGQIDPEGGLRVNNDSVRGVRTSKKAAFKQWGRGALSSAKAMAPGMAAMGGAMLLGAGLNMGASAVENKRQRDIAEGKYKENSNADWRKRNTSTALGWAGQGAAIGASIGMMFSPVGALIGAAAGGILGGIGGLIKGKSEQRKEQEKVRLLDKIASFRNGQRLTGEYDNVTLSRIAKYAETNDASHLTSSDLDKLRNNGNDYNIVLKKKMAKGGFISGPSHSNGGVPVSGTGVELEGGEFVVNRKDAIKNMHLLKSINSGTNITPMPLNTQSMSVYPNNSTSSVSRIGATEISLKPLDINISGTIKLDLGKGKQIDISSELLNNTNFVRSISELVDKEVQRKINGGNIKESSINKLG